MINLYIKTLSMDYEQLRLMDIHIMRYRLPLGLRLAPPSLINLPRPYKGYSISIGGNGSITKEQALKHVNKNDKIGKLLVAADRHYFNLIKSGELYAGITD